MRLTLGLDVSYHKRDTVDMPLSTKYNSAPSSLE